MANYNKVILVGNLTRDPQLQVSAQPDGRRRFRHCGESQVSRTQTGEDREEVLLRRLLGFGKNG